MFSVLVALTSLSFVSRILAATYDVDVFVYGGTPAGILAALGAAGEGARVLLLEPRAGCIGGMMSGGLANTDIGVTTAVIGGRTRAFFEAVTRHYGAAEPLYDFEPSVALKIFEWQLAQAGSNLSVTVGGRVVALAAGAGARIASATLADGSTISARVFVDCTYEGALLPLARVSYAFGREPASAFGESVAGVLPEPHPTWEAGHPFTSQGQPWVNISGLAADGTLLPGVSPAPGAVGSGDEAVQSYGWRVTWTWNSSNMLRPWPRPSSYDPSLYELQLRAILQRNLTSWSHILGLGTTNELPGHSLKMDMNNHYLSQPYRKSPPAPQQPR